MEFGSKISIIGMCILVFNSLYARFKAIEDRNVDKVELWFGFYIFRYPLLLIIQLIGIALLIIGLVFN